MSGTQWVEAGDAAEHPTVHGTAPKTKDRSAQNAISAKAEKSLREVERWVGVVLATNWMWRVKNKEGSRMVPKQQGGPHFHPLKWGARGGRVIRGTDKQPNLGHVGESLPPHVYRGKLPPSFPAVWTKGLGSSLSSDTEFLSSTWSTWASHGPTPNPQHHLSFLWAMFFKQGLGSPGPASPLSCRAHVPLAGGGGGRRRCPPTPHTSVIHSLTTN